MIGIAVSPRGDDRPGSARNTISPVRFIKAVGDAYRKAGRKKPIMDNVALHPYPNVNTDPPDKGAPWPQVSVANLDRAQQAFWDGFNGTGQPTFEEIGVRQTTLAGAPVRWVLDEAGWQTDTHGLPGYFGTENTPTIDEATQAAYYKQVIQRYACDDHVAALLYFHWIDEEDRDRLQSGLVRANRVMKPAANAVRDAIQSGCSAGRCSGSTRRRSTAPARRGSRRTATSSRSRRSRMRRSSRPRRRPRPRSRSRSAAQKLKAVKVKGKIKAYQATGVKFKAIKYANSRSYTYSVKITSSLNTKRSVTLKTKKIKKPDIEI